MIYWGNMKIKEKILFIVYCLLFTSFTIYSYAFLDVGLTLTSWEPYLRLQKQMRWFGYFNRPQSTIIFIILSCLLFIVYYLLLKAFKKEQIKFKSIIFLSVISVGILVFSYPAFSADIFNYIFNAKMVLIYHTNPHIHSAWEFSDSMLGFMRNIHTPAPYFYGWTLISLVPWVIGINRIFTELISFKLFSGLSFILIFFILKKIYSKYKLHNDKLRLTLFLLNPLILIEAIGVGHNDLSMVLLALSSFYFLVRYKNDKKLRFLFCAIFFLTFSTSIKYATVVLLPFFIIWYFKDKFDLGLWGAIFLFLLPFSRPMDQLHSWYLIWPLTWVLLSRNMKSVYYFYFLSFFSLLRYAPYIWYGNWDSPVVLLRLLIYFVIPLIFLPRIILKKN